MMKLLPNWVLPDSRPSVYDTESATVIEMTAKLHAAMNELIAQYNAFVDEINSDLAEFVSGSKEEMQTFETAMRQEFQDFIDIINLKIAEIENGGGSGTTSKEYDPNTESLTM